MGLIKDFQESVQDFRTYRSLKAKQTQMTFQGAGGGMSTTATPSYDSWAAWDQAINRFFGGTKIDYAAELGDLSLSSLVMAAARWVSKNLNDARLQVVTLDGDQKETEVDNHPLPALWRRPNPYYSGQTLLRGLAVSWIVAATAYILIIRDGGGNPVEMWYEPHNTIRPRWPASGSELLSHYELWRNGEWQRWEPENVFVVYDNFDPATRRGNNGLTALLKDIYTDEQAARFTAQLMRNGLVPPIVVNVGDKDRPFTGDISEVADRINRKMSGDESGKPIVTNDPVHIEKLGFDYSATGMQETREVSESRFCAVMGISAESLRLGVAAKHSTYNNVKELRIADYQDYIMPLHSLIAEEMDVRFLSEMGPEGARTQFDYAGVQILQPDQAKETGRTVELFKNRIIDQAEARERESYKSEPIHIGVYYPVPQTNITMSPLGGMAAPVVDPNAVDPNAAVDPNLPVKSRAFDVLDEQDAANGEDWWRRSAPKQGRGLIDAQPVKPNGGLPS